MQLFFFLRFEYKYIKSVFLLSFLVQKYLIKSKNK